MCSPCFCYSGAHQFLLLFGKGTVPQEAGLCSPSIRPHVSAPLTTDVACMQACRNSVTVPRHWSQKRKYLQGKRGIEKPPFKLPDFIEATGIGEMRQSYQVRAAGVYAGWAHEGLWQPKVHVHTAGQPSYCYCCATVHGVPKRGRPSLAATAQLP